MCRQNLCLAPEEAVGLPLGIKIGVWKTNHFSWTPKSHSGRPMGSRPKMSLLVPIASPFPQSSPYVTFSLPLCPILKPKPEAAKWVLGDNEVVEGNWLCQLEREASSLSVSLFLSLTFHVSVSLYHLLWPSPLPPVPRLSPQFYLWIPES